MRTSVVIATRNGGARLLRTLRRLEALDPAPAVIVVDNGSDDGTPAHVARCHPRVGLIRLGCDLGGVARTLGARLAATPFVAFADERSWWEAGSLERAETILDAHPGIGLVVARVLVGATGAREDPSSAAMRTSPITAHGYPALLAFAARGTVARRDAFLRAGGFHPMLRSPGEETVLAQDLAAMGLRCAYADGVIARHEPDPRIDRVLARRDALLSAWLRRPIDVAVPRTLAAMRDADARRALAGALRRWPGAMRARRLLPTPVELEVRLVEAAQSPAR